MRLFFKKPVIMFRTSPTSSLRTLATTDLAIRTPLILTPSPTLLLDAATQSPPHSAAFADASTQLPLTEFFLECVYSNDSLDRQPSLPSHGNFSGAPLPIPSTWMPLSVSAVPVVVNVRTPVPRTQLNAAPPPPPGLEVHSPLISPHGILVKGSARATVRIHPLPRRPCSHRLVPPKWETHADSSSATYKRSASTALAGTHHAVGADPRPGRGPFPMPRRLVLPMVCSTRTPLSLHGATHRSSTTAPPLTFRDTNHHILLSIHNVVAKKP